ELFEVANRLEAEGKEVTALALLEALGRGSLTTIYKHLEVWKTAKPSKAQLSNNEMPDRVKSAFLVAWREASQEAGQAVEEAREKAKEEVAAALRQFHGALEAIAKLEKEREADADQIQALNEHVDKLAQDVSSLEAINAVLKAQNEAQAKDLERLQKELAKAQAERDESMRNAAELKGRLSTLEAHNSELMAAIKGKK
ncbi:MAG: hypothetical protein HC888_04910, partial [Candidatus Competibacteraceae bacterium]|nr:hypothetical protein [Candidatus Competibacteraceae bacterium]